MYPEQWEYLIIDCPSKDHLDILTQKGLQGWELVFERFVEFVYTEDKAHRIPYDRYEMTFKRGIKNLDGWGN